MSIGKRKGNLHLLEEVLLYKDDCVELCLSPTNMRTTVRYADTSYRWKKNVITRKVVEYRISNAQEIFETWVERRHESMDILSYLLLRTANGVRRFLAKAMRSL